MTKIFYRTGNHKINHSIYGGRIYASDFNTDFRGKDNTNGSTIANRIVQDQKYDEQCKKNIENKQNYEGNRTDKNE